MFASCLHSPGEPPPPRPPQANSHWPTTHPTRPPAPINLQARVGRLVGTLAHEVMMATDQLLGCYNDLKGPEAQQASCCFLFTVRWK